MSFVVQAQYRAFGELHEGINRGVLKWKDIHLCATRDEAEYWMELERDAGFVCRIINPATDR